MTDRDLDNRAAIHDLVIDFYREVALDDVLAPVFTEVAEVDWATHLPRLVDYWCRVLLGQPGYDGRILGPHERLHAVGALDVVHLDRWHRLFVAAVDARSAGPVADRAKEHAVRIGNLLGRRLLDVDWRPVAPARTAPGAA